MKFTASLALGILAVSTFAFAQAPDDAVKKALLGAPARMKKEDVTVIKWKPDFTYDTLQKGSSGMACYDLSGWPGHPAFMIECTSMGNLPRVAQNLKAEAKGDRKAAQAELDAEETAGTRVKPEFGSAWIHFMGPDQDHARTHLTIAVPGATAQSLGLSDKPNPTGIWIMNAGTTTAHLMVPER
jgi:hypothetical protein